MSETIIYIHTINGKAGAFDGQQICDASFYGSANAPAYSLKQIQKERQKTIKWRQEQGFPVNSQYGHKRFRVQTKQEPQ